jgi:hypothetical protein
VGWSTRLFGRTPADTSEVVARNFYLSPSVAVIANAAAYPDALAAGSVAGQSFLPLLFTRPTVLDTSVARYISANSGSIDYVEMFGRPTVPSAAVLRRAVALAGGRIPR